MYLIVYNPVSGVGDDELQYLESTLERYEIEFDVLVTEDDKTIVNYLSSSAIQYDCIVAAGGDGTISQVIEALALNTISTKLLIYPRGTTNEYASSLNVTKDTFVKLLEGRTSMLPVDIGVYNREGVFTYSFVFGNFSHVPYETPQWLKNKLGYIAYWIYGFVNLYIFRLKRYEMTFKYNNKVEDGMFLFGSVSNSESLGKVIQLDDVSFSDGLMEVFLIKYPRSLRDVVRFLHDARTGSNSSGLIIKDKVEVIDVDSPQMHSWSADGEFSGKFDSLHIEIKNRPINIVID